jgi:hypothetical protein
MLGRSLGVGKKYRGRIERRERREDEEGKVARRWVVSYIEDTSVEEENGDWSMVRSMCMYVQGMMITGVKYQLRKRTKQEKGRGKEKNTTDRFWVILVYV